MSNCLRYVLNQPAFIRYVSYAGRRNKKNIVLTIFIELTDAEEILKISRERYLAESSNTYKILVSNS